MNLSFLSAAAEEPERVALIAAGRPHTFAALAPRVRRVIGWLESRGLGPAQPEPVALVAGSRVDTLVACYALLELGLPLVAVHPRLTAGERARLCADARPALVIDESWSEADAASSAEAAPAAPPADDERPLAMVFTSGTTGRPKGAVLSRAAFVASAAASAANLGWRDDDRWLLCMPLSHVGGLSIVTRCLLGRRTVVLAEPARGGRFDAELIAEVTERDRVTLLSLVPTMLRRLLAVQPRWTPPAHLRAVLLGGAAASPSLLEAAAERGVPALTTYGMSETCSQITTQRYGTRPGAEHGSGAPLQGVELRIVDGEVWVRSPTLMTGYAPAGVFPSPFVDGGWFPTGDFGALDDQGRLHIHARRTDLIVSGGENVYPAEVELALEALPGVGAACAFGVPDPEWGQRVAVAIVAAPDGPPDDGEIVAFFREHLASHKRPREIAYLAELPATRSGKIDRGATARAATPLLRSLPHG